ncbi:hypothetical protein CEXT_534801 [Caerostris extrusa]|uniref:Uncharacterized protein n=1 Tax=Caerostris extrusa TaxID=172846 RepID=A0AAV4SEG9_CAEEX|nr:hypothetical protein CEXT_534801 [Caerostris extrusa]
MDDVLSLDMDPNEKSISVKMHMHEMVRCSWEMLPATVWKAYCFHSVVFVFVAVPFKVHSLFFVVMNEDKQIPLNFVLLLERFTT